MKDDSEGFGLSNWINDGTIQLPEEKERKQIWEVLEQERFCFF